MVVSRVPDFIPGNPSPGALRGRARIMVAGATPRFTGDAALGAPAVL